MSKQKEIIEVTDYRDISKNPIFKYAAAYSEQAWQANKAIAELEEKYIDNEEVSQDIRKFLNAFFPMVYTYNELVGKYFLQELGNTTQERND